ncbi:uncharacterized protein I206_104408 [Kwoniella pini CBS 10737]|uniref:NADP-dependent oxidoreductase domain-containing protein n=1 Tax=Kwoniella pini CBS 10737 TaxID=1296096 RepID=A0AAJ8L7D7_9TREE
MSDTKDQTFILAGKPTIRMGLGLMGLTAGLDEPLPDEQAFTVIKTSLDADANLLNTALFYGSEEDPLSNLKLLGRFFETYPKYKDKAIVSVKGGMIGKFSGCTGDYEYLKNEILIAKDLLKGKEIDIFAPARLPDDRPLEETINNLIELQKEGLFKTIGLSEVSYKTIEKINNLTNGEKISSNEIEISLQTLNDSEILKTIKICEKLNIKIIGYSPFGHGFLSGKITKNLNEIGKKDWRNFLPRLSNENFNKNLNLLNEIKNLSKKNNKSIVELILGSILNFNKIIIPLPGTINFQKVSQNVNVTKIILSDEEMKEILEIIERNPVFGNRYPDVGMGLVVSC